MSRDNAFVSYVLELMQSIGPVRAKRMFGGHGIFLDDLMFALIADEVLYLKADKETENEFITKGLDAFTYDKKNKTLSLSYFQAPEEALEDNDEMKLWANKAYSAALRAASKKRKNSESSVSNIFTTD